ncbi:hypothetical protein QBC38DRAFT_525649 [Podospora fimiseda]|uniref:ATP-grasp domain-containing protein n=1 Tax=Podospora fimiseda TaxID=252190 RepID=A0AAN7BYE1_9PEZI|nr:hypothetical protein QBC38DRAFT_525649 [Podospora fimiseda]
MVVNDGRPERIVAAVKSLAFPVHGITTVAERYLCTTPKAAEMISQPTSPGNALQATPNKGLLLRLIPLTTTNINQPVAKDSHFIVKPSEGSGSFGIFLDKSNAERQTAEDALESMGTKPVIETYLISPEVDVNPVLVPTCTRGGYRLQGSTPKGSLTG